MFGCFCLVLGDNPFTAPNLRAAVGSQKILADPIGHFRVALNLNMKARLSATSFFFYEN